jgi:hypothetical protein
VERLTCHLFALLCLTSKVYAVSSVPTQIAVDAETKLKLAEYLCDICATAAPLGALKSGDQLQVQRLLMLVHRLRVSSATAKAQHASMQRAKTPPSHGAANH